MTKAVPAQLSRERAWAISHGTNAVTLGLATFAFEQEFPRAWPVTLTLVVLGDAALYATVANVRKDYRNTHEASESSLTSPLPATVNLE